MPSATLLANTAGGVDFFSSGHSNLLTGAGSALDADALAATVKALRQMKDASGSLIDVQPRLLLVPPTLEFTAKAWINSNELLRVTTDNLPTGTPYQGLLDVVVDGLLEDSGFTGYSSAAWYAWGSPSNATMVAGFLDGRQSPTVEFFGMDSDVDTLGVAYRAHLDFGFALCDYRTAIKNAGSETSWPGPSTTHGGFGSPAARQIRPGWRGFLQGAKTMSEAFLLIVLLAGLCWSAAEVIAGG